MDDPTKPKRNRAERKAQKQQAKKSDTKNVNDGNDDVFEDCQQEQQQQQVYLLLCSVYRFIFCMRALSYLLNRISRLKRFIYTFDPISEFT